MTDAATDPIGPNLIPAPPVSALTPDELRDIIEKPLRDTIADLTASLDLAARAIEQADKLLNVGDNTQAAQLRQTIEKARAILRGKA
jgi:hypothetical protein